MLRRKEIITKEELSIFEFAMTAELKKWRRIFYSFILNLK